MTVPRLLLLPWLVLAVSLGVTWLMWDHERHAAGEELRSQFDFSLREAASRVEQRMAAYEQMLRGVQGLITATGKIDRATFASYVNALQVDANFSGIQAVGIAELVTAAGADGHVAAMRRAGYPNYAIWPEGQRETYAPVIQREPQDGRERMVLGVDIWAEPVRRLAMEAARDSAMAALSGKVRLTTDTQANAQPGSVLYLPIYAPGQPHDSVAQRRAHLIGWVYASFRMHDLMASLYGQQPPGVAVAIYDGVEPGEAHLLFRSADAGGRQHHRAAIAAEEYLVVAGHTWVLSMHTMDDFEARFGRNAAPLIAGGGTVLSLLLALLAWSLATGRARAVALAASMTKELRESGQRWAFALEGAGDGVWDWNLRTRKAVTSLRWKEIVGDPDGADTIDGWEALIHPDDRPDAVAGMQACLSQRSEARATCVAEHRLSCGDGKWKWILLRGMVIERDGDGTPLRVIGTITDITDRKATEERLRAAMEAAEASNRAKSVFLAMMSHEIRTPLSGVVGTAELLLDSTLTPDQGECVQTIRASARALLAVVDDILDLSKLDAGRIEVEAAPFNLLQVLNDVALILRPRAAEHGIGFSLAVAADLPATVLGDVTRLRQVLLNLGSNAVKFTETGGVIVRVCRDGGAGLLFEVQDTGIGIDDQAKQRLFEEFSQADNSIARRYGGSGLGLNISLRLVELMGGRITVDSQLGQGSTFRFVLPLPEAPLPAAAELLPERQPLPSLDVLLAEDNPVNAKVLETILRRAGHRVVAVRNGQAAVEAASGRHFDVVLMDMQMPVMDGLAATRAIRALAAPYGAVAILGVTANAFVDDRQRCLDAGMNGYISKPVTPVGLFAAIDALLVR
jgi:PAS domain S-box-containing protein